MINNWPKNLHIQNTTPRTTGTSNTKNNCVMYYIHINSTAVQGVPCSYGTLYLLRYHNVIVMLLKMDSAIKVS